MFFDSQRVLDPRTDMVERQLVARGISSVDVLRAMQHVPRHAFVPPETRAVAYADRPLEIGHGATISQPYIVALMSTLLGCVRRRRVLDVGTGSGYQAAVLARMGAEVFSAEIREPLARTAAKRLQRLGWQRVQVRHGDGRTAWRERAPFTGVLAAAAADEVPAQLVAQLEQGGRLVMPVGHDDEQELLVVTRTSTGYRERSILPVRFVALVDAGASTCDPQ